jgi:hypothetical protein
MFLTGNYPLRALRSVLLFEVASWLRICIDIISIKQKCTRVRCRKIFIELIITTSSNFIFYIKRGVKRFGINNIGHYEFPKVLSLYQY